MEFYNLLQQYLGLYIMFHFMLKQQNVGIFNGIIKYLMIMLILIL